MNDFARKPRIPWLCIGEEYMRNPLGLLLGCVVAAAMIAGAWLFATSLRADQAAPQTVAAKPVPLHQPCMPCVAGTFEDDPYYAEAMRLGRKYRDSLRPKAAKKKRDK